MRTCMWLTVSNCLLWTGSLIAQPMGSLLPAPQLVNPSVIHFDPEALALQKVDGRWLILANKKVLKDCGPVEREAQEALRVIRELNLTEYGVVSGSIPPFEFWLSNGEVPRTGFGARLVIPFHAGKLRIDQVAGAWCVRDDRRVLYNFGNQSANARQALGILKKYHFNLVGVVGQPHPIMTYPLLDPYERAEPGQPTNTSLANLATVSEQGLVLPEIGYVGPRFKIDSRKLEVSRLNTKDWGITHNGMTLANFGRNESAARDGLRMLQDLRINEVCRLGASGFPIYLINGRIPFGAPLGVNVGSFRGSFLRVQTLAGNWCVTEGSKVLFEFGEHKADAELMVKVLNAFHADQIWHLGNAPRTELRIIGKGR